MAEGLAGDFGAEGLEAVEILDGAAIEALGLGLVTDDEEKAGGFAGKAVKAFGEPIGAVLAGGDGDSVGDFRVLEDQGSAGAFGGFVQAGDEESGFESGAAKERQLGESDSLDSEEFLGIDGPIEGNEVVAEAGDGFGGFEPDDGVIFGVEDVFA
jgi:hypothetical protein